MIVNSSVPAASEASLRRSLMGCLLVLAACSSAEPSPEGHSGSGGGGANPGGSGSAAGSQARAGESNAGSGAGAGAGDGGSSSNAGDASGGTAGQSAAGSGGGGGTFAGDYGFTYRAPGEENLDWLCTFTEAEEAYVYVRLVQTGTTNAGLATIPVYSTEQALLSQGGEISELSGAKYDYGGGHHNDSLAFDHGGKSHRYYHSSFGFGFRACQNMDCRDVYALGTTTLETEGCARGQRALPEVCVSIEPDGSHEPLVDTFMTCAGDMP